MTKYYGRSAIVNAPAKRPDLPRCEHCGAEFLPRSAWQKFCKPSCRVTHWQKEHLGAGQ